MQEIGIHGLFIMHLNVASDDLLPENYTKRLIIIIFFSLYYANTVIIVINNSGKLLLGF